MTAAALSSATSALRLAGTDPAPAQVPSAPGYIPPAGTIQRLRDVRRIRRIFRDLDSGAWRKVLLDERRSQYRFEQTARNSGAVSECLTKINQVSLALDIHAAVIAGNPVRLSTAEENVEQNASLAAMRERCMFDALFMEAMRKAYIERECALRADIDPATGSAVISSEDNETCLPIGPLGADRQPTVWERRWVVERYEGTDRRQKYLRVERHRVIGGEGVIEQECYRTDSDDVLQELHTLTRVSVTLVTGAAPDGAPSPDQPVRTGLPYPLIVRLVTGMQDGEPRWIINQDDIDLLDAAAAAFSRIVVEHEKHARSRLKGPEQKIDPATGAISLSDGYIVDPDDKVRYLTKEHAFEAMQRLLEFIATEVSVQLAVSPALTGRKLGGGATPDSFDKLRLESANTTARGKVTARYAAPAVGRLFTVASLLEATQPMRGFAVAPVTATLRPEIPKDSIDIAREQRELLEAGLTSRRRAVIAIHGEEQAADVLAEIEGDEEARTRQQQAAVFSAVGGVTTEEEEGDGR